MEVQEASVGDCLISESSNEKYFGQIISSDGTNVANVASRAGKGAGMKGTVESIMKNVPVADSTLR